MLKKILIKIWKFILLILIAIKTSLFGGRKDEHFILIDDNNDDSGEEKKIGYKYSYNVDNNTETIYKDIKKITKEIEDFENDLNLSREDKISKIIDIKEKIDLLEHKNNEIVPKKTIQVVAKEKVSEIIYKNKEELKEYTIKNKLDIPKKEEKKVISKKEEVKIEKDVKKDIKEDKEEKKEIENIEEKVEEKVEDKKVETYIPNVVIPAAILLSTIENKDKKRDTYIAYVKESNKVLKEAKEIFNEVEEDIRFSRKYDENKFKIMDLKEKIKKIRENYYDFKHNRYIYELENNFDLQQIDKFELLVNSSNVDNYLKKCNIMIEKLDEYKKHDNLMSKKFEKKQTDEKKKEPVKKEEKDEKEKKPRLLIEIDLASKVIEKDITRQNQMINDLERSMLKVPTFERRNKRIGFFDNILNNTMRMGFNILPIRFIRNRKLAMLISGFMFNNSIRTMRKSLAPEVNIDFIMLNRHLKTELDVASSYERVCNDSLYQVSVLKEEFLKHYGYLNNAEVKRIYMKLESLEVTITNELDRINESKTYINNKVKKLNNPYGKK